MKFPLGTKFISRSNRKIRRVETVVDYHVTRNMAGEIVMERYVCAYEFMGQTIVNGDVIETTIAMGERVE